MVDHSNRLPVSNVSRLFLDPVSVDTFFSDYWEQKPLFLDRGDSDQIDRFTALLSTSAIESLFSTDDLYFPNVLLSRANDPIASEEYVGEENRILPTRVKHLFRSGATVVVSQAHRKLTGLNQLVRQLQCEFAMRCQANVYLTPGGSQGLKAHYDTHDVFILQVEGQKTFNFYSRGAELPFNTDTFDPSLSENGSLESTICLNPGDSLYIPRGFRHDAIACGEAPSLHITLGMFPRVMRDYLQTLIQVSAEKDARLRASGDLVDLMSVVDSRVSVETLKGLFDSLLSEDNLREVESRLRDEVSLFGNQDCAGLFSEATVNTVIVATDHFLLDRSKVLNIERMQGTTKLRTVGQVLEFDGVFAPVLEWIVATDGFTVDELPGLDNDQKIAMVERLNNEGLLLRPVAQS